MNIALSAVVISILLIPPIAFYLSYTFGNFSKAGPKFTFLDGVLASAIVSLFVHAFAILIIPYPIRFDVLLKLLGGEVRNVEEKISNSVFATSVKQFALYNFVILFSAVLCGRIVRGLVTRNGLNNGENDLYRLNNRWWYLFNGIENNIEDFGLLIIDAVVDTKDGTMIYSGILVNYVCHVEELDRVYLKDVLRREFKKSDIIGKLENKTGEHVNIPGETVTIPYKNIINMNLKYLILEDSLEAIERTSRLRFRGDSIKFYLSAHLQE